MKKQYDMKDTWIESLRERKYNTSLKPASTDLNGIQPSNLNVLKRPGCRFINGRTPGRS
jgi:hypothetical protein